MAKRSTEYPMRFLDEDEDLEVIESTRQKGRYYDAFERAMTQPGKRLVVSEFANPGRAQFLKKEIKDGKRPIPPGERFKIDALKVSNKLADGAHDPNKAPHSLLVITYLGPATKPDEE